MSAASTPEADLVARLVEFDSATLYEAGGQHGAMLPGIHALQGGKRVAGPAMTILCPPGDNLMLHAAIAEARRGEILVAQCHDPSYGVWGEVMTEAAMARGVAALVVEGSVRDIDTIRDLGFPIFASGLSIRGTKKTELGCLRVPISCGGLLVWPGDYVLADDSGIVILPAATVQATVAAAEARRDKEAAIIERLRGGATTLELLGLEPIMAQLSQERGM
jgi:4-hydroxy-4-methyl-2-oxoglutarate aldolase